VVGRQTSLQGRKGSPVAMKPVSMVYRGNQVVVNDCERVEGGNKGPGILGEGGDRGKSIRNCQPERKQRGNPQKRRHKHCNGENVPKDNSSVR